MNGAAISSGMGTCGLVGQIGVYTGWISDIENGVKASITALDWAGLIIVSFVLPAIVTLAVALPMRKKGLIKADDLKLDI